MKPEGLTGLIRLLDALDMDAAEELLLNPVCLQILWEKISN